ncbi:MAG: hypothetical protein AAF214_00510 [Pseudomonadota bacterium]
MITVLPVVLFVASACLGVWLVRTGRAKWILLLLVIGAGIFAAPHIVTGLDHLHATLAAALTITAVPGLLGGALIGLLLKRHAKTA